MNFETQLHESRKFLIVCLILHRLSTNPSLIYVKSRSDKKSRFREFIFRILSDVWYLYRADPGNIQSFRNLKDGNFRGDEITAQMIE
jgi:hypothetical protein